MATVHTSTPKTITENGAIRKPSPEWSDLKTMLSENAVFHCGRRKQCYLKTATSSKRHDRAPGHSTVSIQNGGQTLPCTFSLDWRCRVDERKRQENDKCGRKSF